MIEGENLFIPTDFGETEPGGQTYVPGGVDENGNSYSVELGPKDPIDGTVPYREVYGEYAGRAGAAMDREKIPDSMRDAVERYFSSLN